MWEKIKEFFAAKYRIIPVFADNKRVGVVVQKRGFLGYWHTMMMPKIEKVKCENDVITEREAFFLKEEEAMEFVKYQKSSL